MAQIRIEAAGLTSGIEELTSLNESFRTKVDTLEESEENLSSMWEGEARTAFRTAFRSDKAQMTNFYNAILEYISVLQTILSNYEKMEAANVEIATVRTYK